MLISGCLTIKNTVPPRSFHTTQCEIFNFGRFSFSHRPTNNYVQWSVISHFNGSAGIRAGCDPSAAGPAARPQCAATAQQLGRGRAGPGPGRRRSAAQA
jgi:hypothetical protein